MNEYDLHRRAHGWFANGEVGDLHSLNERVYDELFLTPSSDPWLGLLPDSVFTGIDESTPRPRAGADVRRDRRLVNRDVTRAPEGQQEGSRWQARNERSHRK